MQTTETHAPSSIAAAPVSASTALAAPPRTQLAAMIGGAAEWLAGALVVVEIVLLFVGVVARYVFHHPLIATDELSSILFLWLSMLGAVIAFERGEHMRMTLLVNRVGPRSKLFLEMLAVTVALTFLTIVAWPAWGYAESETAITTPALEIPDIWRAAAMPVGMVLMAILGVCRLWTFGERRLAVAAIALNVAVVAILVAMRPLFDALGQFNLVVFFVGVVAASVAAGVPIAFCFGVSTLGYLALTTTIPLQVVVGTMDQGMSNLILLSVPLFVFLGLLIEMTGMARAMVLFLASLVGHLRGGLSYVLVGAMYLVSGISGAKAADMAAVAPVLFPEMEARGAKRGDLVALLAATGAQTETVPPSLVLLTIGSVTGVSISALFTGGLLPGLVLGVMLCLVVRFHHRKEDLSGVGRASRRDIAKALWFAVPALILPFVIRFAVIEGIATATEVSTIGIAYSLVVGLLVYRRFDWARLRPMLTETASLSGAILLIIGAATGMAWALTQSGFSATLAAAMEALPGGKVTFMLVSILAFCVLGSVLEGIPAIVLFGPLLFPIARAVGINEVHYAMVVILSMGLGLFAPPFGVGYYAACAIARVNPDEGMKPMISYIVALMIGLLIVAAVPAISLCFLS